MSVRRLGLAMWKGYAVEIRIEERNLSYLTYRTPEFDTQPIECIHPILSLTLHLRSAQVLAWVRHWRVYLRSRAKGAIFRNTHRDY